MTDRRDNEPIYVRYSTDSRDHQGSRISSRTLQKSPGGRAILMLLALEYEITLTTKDGKIMMYRWENDQDA